MPTTSTCNRTYFMYLNINNLYDWVICQPLPDFQWIDNTSEFNVMDIALILWTNFFKIYMEYPYLHDAHTELSSVRQAINHPASDKTNSQLCMIKSAMSYIIVICNSVFVTASVSQRYTVYCNSRNLHGFATISNLIRILKHFDKFKNDFDKNLYKLMNNVIFCKTMENMHNYVDERLMTQWKDRYGAETLIAKPNFYYRSVFSENLVV